MQEEVGLLASAAEPRAKAEGEAANEGAGPGAAKGEEPGAEQAKEKPGRQARVPAPFDYQKAILPDEEPPPATPGAIVRVLCDPDHGLAFGYAGTADVVHDSSNILTPVKLDRGTNVAIYADAAELVRAGFVWDETKRQLPKKAYLVHQPHGRGHVVAFAENPNVRAFADGLDLLLLNAVLLTAGR